MRTRRGFIRSLVGASVMMPVASDAEGAPTVEQCRKGAGELAELMQRTCGGQWRVSVDQNLEFVLVQKVLG